MARRVAYIAATDQYRLLFGRALEQVGYGQLHFGRDLDSGLDHMDDTDSDGLVIVHGGVAGRSMDLGLIEEIRVETSAPVVLLGFDPQALSIDREDVMVVPPPVTVAALAQAAASMRHVPHSQLVRRLIRTRTFESFSADAVAFLLSRARARQLQPGELLFGEGDPGDSMHFVLVGSIALSIGDRVLESVGPGGIFGEMAMLEGRERSAKAEAEGVTVLLEIDHASVEEADTAFRAVLFELITRTTIRRLRATNASLVESDGARTRTEMELAQIQAGRGEGGGDHRTQTAVDPSPFGRTD